VSEDALVELERHVGEKWIAAASARTPQWPLPDDPLDISTWQTDTTPLPDDWPQFPREQWASYPAKRTVTLLLCDRMLDFDELTDEQWTHVCFLMQYGGKTRLS
jgi:hypothetical protein